MRVIRHWLERRTPPPKCDYQRIVKIREEDVPADRQHGARLGWEIRSEFREFRRNSEFRSLFLAELPVLVSDSDRKVGSRHFFNITEPIPAINVPIFFRGILFPRFFVHQERGEPPLSTTNSLPPTVMKLSNPLVGITIKFEHPIMMDGDDRSDSGDEGNPRGFSQESSDSLPLLSFKTIWDCPGITLDEMENHDGKVIVGWRCGYCPVPGLGLGGAPFYKYRNATKALSHLSPTSKDIHRCKGYNRIPPNVRNALTALKYSKLNEKSDRAARKNTIREEVITHQENALSLKEISR